MLLLLLLFVLVWVFFCCCCHTLNVFEGKQTNNCEHNINTNCKDNKNKGFICFDKQKEQDSQQQRKIY